MRRRTRVHGSGGLSRQRNFESGLGTLVWAPSQRAARAVEGHHLASSRSRDQPVSHQYYVDYRGPTRPAISEAHPEMPVTQTELSSVYHGIFLRLRLERLYFPDGGAVTSFASIDTGNRIRCIYHKLVVCHRTVSLLIRKAR